MSEELVIRHCSPTLAGIKTGNIFTYKFDSVYELRESIRGLNNKLSSKGLRVLPLKVKNNSALIYVYRPSKLKCDLSEKESIDILKEYGYVCAEPEKCVVTLINRLNEQETFPHEIGLFLGYPPEDVRGFINNKAQRFKCVGCWKVYGDVKRAETLFLTYKKCTASYMKQHKKGDAIEVLAVAV